MSGAIQRDREIAAKATQGGWVQGHEDHSHYLRDKSHFVYAEGSDIANADKRVDAEHIVRLHNRQPLYDALVDGIREDHDKCHRIGAPDSIMDTIAFCPHAQCKAIAALDREEP